MDFCSKNKKNFIFSITRTEEFLHEFTNILCIKKFK